MRWGGKIRKQEQAPVSGCVPVIFDERKKRKMSNGFTNVMKGIGAGMAAGIAMGVVGSTMVKSSGSGRKLKKNSKHAIQAMENLLENAQMMFK